METNTMQAAIKRLEQLAYDEYGSTLSKILDQDEPWTGGEYDSVNANMSRDAVWRIGRLIGITVKQPFSEKPSKRVTEASQTGANRTWMLKDRDALIESPPYGPEYNLIVNFISDDEVVRHIDWILNREKDRVTADDVISFLEQAHGERGVFRTFCTFVRSYLCKNEEIQSSLKSLGIGRVSADIPTLVAAGFANESAKLIVDAVPWLSGSAPETFVAGFLLLIISAGLDNFCNRTLPPPLTDEVET